MTSWRFNDILYFIVYNIYCNFTKYDVLNKEMMTKILWFTGEYKIGHMEKVTQGGGNYKRI